MAFTPVQIDGANGIVFPSFALDASLWYDSGALWTVFLDKSSLKLETWRSKDGGLTWVAIGSTISSAANLSLIGVTKRGPPIQAVLHEVVSGELEVWRFGNGWLAGGATELLNGPVPVTAGSLLPRKWSIFKNSNPAGFDVFHRGADVGGLQRIYRSSYGYDSDTWGSAVEHGSGHAKSHAMIGSLAVRIHGSVIDRVHVFLGTPDGDILQQTWSPVLGNQTLQTLATADLEAGATTGVVATVGAPTSYFEEDASVDNLLIAFPYAQTGGHLVMAVAEENRNPTWTIEQFATSPEYNPGVMGSKIATISAVAFGAPEDLYAVWTSHDTPDKIYYSRRVLGSPPSWTDPVLHRAFGASESLAYLHAAPTPDGIGLIWQDGLSGNPTYDLIELTRAATASRYSIQ